MNLLTGWILDLYEEEAGGLALWLIADDGQRLCLRQDFPVTFYAAGPAPRLRELWRWLRERPERPQLARQERQDLFLPQPIAVLAVQVERPALLRPLFYQVEQSFPDLTYYDVDLNLQTRHAAQYGTFPLARCSLQVEGDRIQAIKVEDTPWDLEPDPPPLRVLELSVDHDPRHAAPARIRLAYGAKRDDLPFLPGEAPAAWVRMALKLYDPDILVTDYGDTWLLEELLHRVGGDLQRLPLNRDLSRGLRTIAEKTYFSYGQVIYRGQQQHLFGRVHIDRKNAMMWGDYELDGILENARVTALPIQTAARVSPGTGISAMQMITALKSGVLVPWHKQQVETVRPIQELIHSDFGGLVYQPTLGVHADVGEIDFVSMYPAVMVRRNISPEKQPIGLSDPPAKDPGLVPRTLEPLLLKRVALKNRIAALPRWDPRRRVFKARASAQKWLLVVCFGYMGYRNARFGRIEAHEAITSGGREALLIAKDAAEDLGFEVLHLFVDCLWIHDGHSRAPADFQPVIDEINQRTGLKIAMDGVYRWVAFLPSKVDPRIPVGTRYFGVFQDGEIKVRGIEARRRDTAPWVAETQMALIEHLAQAPDLEGVYPRLQGAVELLRREVERLRAGRVPLEKLLMGQKLSRALEKYTTPSPAARAALQLQKIGVTTSPGQRVRFLFTRGRSDVWAWDLPETPDPQLIDVPMYRKLLLRAADTVLQPFGIESQELAQRVSGDPVAVPLPGIDRPGHLGEMKVNFRSEPFASDPLVYALVEG